MTDSIQQFEAWAARHHGVLSIGKVGEYYSNPAVNNDWFVWQASRAAIVVELPCWSEYDTTTQYKQAIESRLEDAGVSHQ